MRTYPTPLGNVTVSSIVLGLMRIPKLTDAEIDRLVRTAIEVGVTMVDHADVYGGAYVRDPFRRRRAPQCR